MERDETLEGFIKDEKNMKRERDNVRCNVNLTCRYKRVLRERERAKEKNWLHTKEMNVMGNDL